MISSESHLLYLNTQKCYYRLWHGGKNCFIPKMSEQFHCLFLLPVEVVLLRADALAFWEEIRVGFKVGYLIRDTKFSLVWRTPSIEQCTFTDLNPELNLCLLSEFLSITFEYPIDYLLFVFILYKKNLKIGTSDKEGLTELLCIVSIVVHYVCHIGWHVDNQEFDWINNDINYSE